MSKIMANLDIFGRYVEYIDISIGFEDNGDVLVSPVAHGASLIKLGVEVTQALNVGRFSEGQRRYRRDSS